MKFAAKATIFSLLTLALLALPCGLLAMESEDCLDCHSDSDTVGEELVIDSSKFNPTAHAEMGCPSCHESVTDEHPDDGLTPSTANCTDCHEEVADEYAKSDHATNAACGDCHNPHEVRTTTEVSGHDMNTQCEACHEAPEMVKSHDDWLPQAGLHLDMLPCVSCHTQSENYVISLYIINEDGSSKNGDFQPASREEILEITGKETVEEAIDLDGNNKISLTELRAFNNRPAYSAMALQGMMTPEVATHNFDTLDNRWDCSFCHASGPEAMQVSFLSFPDEKGGFRQVEIEKGAVLDILNGTPDFYMTGATRNASLDILGLLIIIGGLGMPIGHGSIRFLTRKNRK